MNNKIIKNILLEKGVTNLYHANTVITASTFLEHGGILSRGYVEDFGLRQTYQSTDELDKKVGVFHDIFFDSTDIHERRHSFNYYGPVLFVYSINVMDILSEGQIKITKDNPIRWNSGMTEEEKYFTSETELQSEYYKGTFKQHLTICNQIEPLSLLTI